MRFAKSLVALIAATACVSGALPARAEDPPAAMVPAERDGSHDFDFNFGVWRTQIKRRAHPFSGSDETIELNGTVNVRKVWDGRAALEEIEADGLNGHWQGMSLFLYNPGAHQWSQTFIGSKSGAFAGGMIGAFKDGHGELFASDTYDGRAILVRGAWSDITPKTHRYEESYSTDGGKTWEVQFNAIKTKLADAVPPSQLQAKPDHAGSRDFDFDIGEWKTHSRRLVHPLAGASDWIETDGVTSVSPVWGGKANLAEFTAKGSPGSAELLALRVYNPAAKQWSINFARSDGGTLADVPGIGQVGDGRLTFFNQERIDGKTTLVRLSIWAVTADTAQSEQAYSLDGGKTWETNRIDRYARQTQ